MAAKNTPVMMIAIEDSFEEDIFVDDSLSWEVVDPSDDDNFSYDSSLDDEDVDLDLDLDDEIKEKEEVSVVGSLDSDVSMGSLVERINLDRMFVVSPVVVVDDDDDDAGDIDGGDYDDRVDDDLDDELVPKWVNDRFERQRMRKLGKREFQKMKNSKRLPFFHNRPGCVHGKHGLGLKHSLM